MTVLERIDAITRFQGRGAEAPRRAAERERQRRDDLVTWKSAALPTIYQSVQRVSEDFAAHGSPFLFSTIPVQAEGSAMFRIKSSRGLRLLSKLQFDLADGQVIATATVAGTRLPLPAPLSEVTQEWVELAAESVLIAMLDVA